jgi:hypothetical protein
MPLPGRMLKKGLLYVDHDTERVHKIVDWEPILPGNQVVIDLREQIHGVESSKGVGWDQRVDVLPGFEVEIPGAGKLTIELAGLGRWRDVDLSEWGDENRNTYRWTVTDDQGVELGSEADIRGGVGETVNQKKAMSTFISFLTACAEAREGVRTRTSSPHR